jgi:hypothetical protein
MVAKIVNNINQKINLSFSEIVIQIRIDNRNMRGMFCNLLMSLELMGIIFPQAKK